MAQPLPAKILCSKFSHIGIQATPVFFFLFVAQYTHHDRWLTPGRIVLLWVIPVAALAGRLYQ